MTIPTPNIPPRPDNAPTGSEWLRSLGVDPESSANKPDRTGPGEAREQAILEQVLSGNIPNFLRNLCPVHISHGDLSGIIYTMPDYIAIGSDDDFVRIRPECATFEQIVRAFDGIIPTPKIIDHIWKEAGVHIDPRPMTPEQGYPRNQSMMWTCRWPIHDKRTQKQFVKTLKPLGTLTAGHLKDIIISTELDKKAKRGKKVGIYGWHRLNGKAIQGVNTFTHIFQYTDYSHGARYVFNKIAMPFLDEENQVCTTKLELIKDVLTDPNRCKLLSGESPALFKNPFYPLEGEV